ncbi:hypothetical protein LR48_Vigan06g103800 [Vigna angularis]|uniref:Uncharacterized protein n=2 Tax=Phaseolus angularis TaxID=3914 RepID=A0A0L9UT21_PHAAN|nr:uncharacterized protein LOC108335380 [Vigna angularis]KAG2376801.1 uncharacterized protein HKW66_Vig0173740 [Vigna angularis]KOM45732.1 hypothetical protein LR48_Vigan06g103800 [Vigna angularis]BAT99267.1 hypothetical protein VIGAN_10066900 [Vigna angularis var. angularis]
MEETLVPKRPREEEEEKRKVEQKDLNFEQDHSSKRQKPYTHILSLLESEEEDSTQDLSPLITSLQQEISSNNDDFQDALLGCPTQPIDLDNLTTMDGLENEAAATSEVVVKEKEEEESEKERVMRHLLQASDDELGIPSSGDGLFQFVGEDGFNSDHGFSSLCDKMWELEDERANYYAFLQSELFLGGH